ncbi:hypothetical protein [Silvimonas soli]|nr:hypothetical protein [Silvimonas soli]
MSTVARMKQSERPGSDIGNFKRHVQIDTLLIEYASESLRER